MLKIDKPSLTSKMLKKSSVGVNFGIGRLVMVYEESNNGESWDVGGFSIMEHLELTTRQGWLL